MPFVAWIVLGLVAGLVAWVLLPGGRAGRGDGRGGCASALLWGLAGIAGSLLGGWLATLLGFGGLAGRLDARNLVVAVLSAIVLLAAWRLLAGPKGRE
jgi:uncharacterized membrane protein YeaQ/YmgE (transglycosylase-associated protein family)